MVVLSIENYGSTALAQSAILWLVEALFTFTDRILVLQQMKPPPFAEVDSAGCDIVRTL